MKKIIITEQKNHKYTPKPFNYIVTEKRFKELQDEQPIDTIQQREYYLSLLTKYPCVQFAPSGGRKCVFQRPLCGAERPLVFS